MPIILHDPPLRQAVVSVIIACHVCRRDCELPCDMHQDCNTLCECWGSCGTDSYCTCRACEALAPDAASDTQFLTIQNAAATSGAAQGNIIAGEQQAALLVGGEVRATLSDILARL